MVGVGRWGFHPGGFFVGGREGGVVMQESIDAVVAVPLFLLIIGFLGWRERIRISRWLGVGHGG